MISLIVSVILLVAGYLVWGRVAERVFGPDDRPTPAIAHNDGVDCVPVKTWKAFLIQLLNIAGTGPIYGALMGAVFGPVVFLWIVFGAILGGAVHDFLCGMISCRHDGKSIAELSGIYLGSGAKWIMRVFTVILLVLCGTVFITSPAVLLEQLTPAVLTRGFWLVVIILYFLLATVLPIDKVIARIYPVFGVVLVTMAVAIVVGLGVKGYAIPEVTLQNLHPEGLSTWPYMFVTVACGAISGFHATQSPMMAKCITSERVGRKVFYGAMLAESVIALVWAAAGVAFYGSTGGLSAALTADGQSGVVYNVSRTLLGDLGALLAVVGVVICPISSGDTAFRAARLTLAEWTGLEQKKIRNRLLLALPLFVVASVLTQIDFDVLWRYFSWSNQTLAAVALWVGARFLEQNGKGRLAPYLAALPGAFMTAVSVTYILMAEEGFRLSALIAYPAGIAFAAAMLITYTIHFVKIRRERPEGSSACKM